MVSSTFSDLEDHRQKVIDAIDSFGCKAVVMEHSTALDTDVIESSLSMVRDSAAYVGLISQKYGQTPIDKTRNPGGLSLTELEFNEAMRLRRPILLFIMGEDHDVKPKDVERDPAKLTKLDAFRERAKKMRDDGDVHRVYKVFNNLEELSEGALKAVGRLAPDIAPKPLEPSTAATSAQDDELPRPPALCALPRYAGSHAFVGRKAQLDTLDDWCSAADPSPILLFEAIGGTGKSMLTWEWLTNYSGKTRNDWAGRFWYSFYEPGATMAAFCRAALRYMTGLSVEDAAKLSPRERENRLLYELNKKPWLFVLDGLERVLVAYHRDDAAKLPDEQADTAVDLIARRDPCAAIRPDDDTLLKQLAMAAPSKILITSRLTPQALVNRSKNTIPGVRFEALPGLRPADAEALIRACGVSGDSKAIQAYLQTHFDCHPLVIGSLAGLINDYLPACGDFDRWAADPDYGGRFSFNALDLVQNRTHILNAAVDILDTKARRVLQSLSLLRSGADFELLRVLNPYLPPAPMEVPEPTDPELARERDFQDEEKRESAKAKYRERAIRYAKYKAELLAWQESDEVKLAEDALSETIIDLRKRGLLQYDRGGRRYDLHPVVRGVVSSRLSADETNALGEQLTNHFTSRPHDPWEHAKDLKDVETGLEIVHVLLGMARHEEAFSALSGDLSSALLYNLDARYELQALMRPFFPNGWQGDPLAKVHGSLVFNLASVALTDTPFEIALAEKALLVDLHEENAKEASTNLGNFAQCVWETGRLSTADRLSKLALSLVEADGDEQRIFPRYVSLYGLAITRGAEAEIHHYRQKLGAMTGEWPRSLYVPGRVEYWHAFYKFRKGQLTDLDLNRLESIARDHHNRLVVSSTLELRGDLHATREAFAEAELSYGSALTLVRETGGNDYDLEAKHIFARLRTGTISPTEAYEQAEQLSGLAKNSLALAKVWRSLDDRDRAIQQALIVHFWAMADGFPFTRLYALENVRAFLSDLGAPLPEVLQHNAAQDKIYPWEASIQKMIAKLARERQGKSGGN